MNFEQLTSDLSSPSYVLRDQPMKNGRSDFSPMYIFAMDFKEGHGTLEVLHSLHQIFLLPSEGCWAYWSMSYPGQSVGSDCRGMSVAPVSSWHLHSIMLERSVLDLFTFCACTLGYNLQQVSNKQQKLFLANR